MLLESRQSWRCYGGSQGIEPGRLRQYARNNVGDVEKRSGQENFLNGLVLPFDHDQPNNHRANRNGNVFRHAEQFHAAGDSGKLGNHVTEVADEDAQHHQEGDTQAVFFANQIAQPFAGHRAHAGAHLLNNNQGHCDRDHGPQEHVAELRLDVIDQLLVVGRGGVDEHHFVADRLLVLPTSQESHVRSSRGLSHKTAGSG